MQRNTPAFLGLKLLLLCVPFVIAILLYLPNAETPYMLQTSVIADKIQRLVLAGVRPQVIIAGESRAFYNVAPEVFTEKTGLSSVNIAVSGETISQVYDALHESGVLNHKGLIIISVSSNQINDTFSDNLPLSQDVIHAEPFGLKKLHDLYVYTSLVFQTMFVNFKDFLHGYIDNSLHNDLHMDDAAFTNKGYTPNTGIFDPTQNVQEVVSLWYTNVVTGGVREHEFLRGIDGFGRTNDTVVIYLSPLAPSWSKKLESTAEPVIEAHFAELISKSIAQYPHMHFIDFQSTPIDALDDTKFADGTHLNKDGAPIFTALLAKKLAEENLLK